MPLGDIADRLLELCAEYRPLFQTGRRNVGDKARLYLTGLLQKAPAKNLERMEDYIALYSYDAQQHFISHSPWDYEAVFAQIGRDVSELIGGPESTLVIDETSFAKQGKHSAGVSRQWNGRLGKVDNSQVGVGAALTDGLRSALVGMRLYLPSAWCDDEARCDKAGIPPERRAFKKKSEIALEMILAAREAGVRFGWTAGDAGYGKEPSFLRGLEDHGLKFVVDVHRNQRVWLKDPAPVVPPRKTGRGRAPSQRVPGSAPVEVRDVFGAEAGWAGHTLRCSTRGDLRVEGVSRRVWLWDGKEKQARHWTLVGVRYPESGITKWFVSNAPADTPLKELLLRHADRYWVERTFQDAKSSLGMADYQVRLWLGWHHHMAMVALALLFMLRERVHAEPGMELLSCQDIVELLNVLIRRHDLTQEVVLQNIRRRHRKRRAAMKSARKRQAAESDDTG